MRLRAPCWQASQHFVRAADLGLPSSAAGCKAGRWQLAEGWAAPGVKGVKGVAVHPLPLEAVLAAIDSAAAQARPPAPPALSPSPSPQPQPQPSAPALALSPSPSPQPQP